MMIVVLKKKLHETQGSQSKFHELYIYIYIYVCVCVCVCVCRLQMLVSQRSIKDSIVIAGFVALLNFCPNFIILKPRKCVKIIIFTYA